MPTAGAVAPRLGATLHEFDFSLEHFSRICCMIRDHAGINLTPQKREMVYNRLSRRLRALGMVSFSEYLDLVAHGSGEEWNNFVGALTTHLTSFFREEHHFPILASSMSRWSANGGKVSIWSCAASTGEEPYSIAITAAEQFDSLRPPVTILATDVDPGVIETARNGVYPLERIKELPERIVRRYFLQGTGRNAGYVKVRPELQQIISFGQMNLLGQVWPMKERYSAIFCRNVMIYFDRPTQKQVLSRCRTMLKQEGLFFAGHSENLSYAEEFFSPCGHTVYRPVAHHAAAAAENQVAV